MSDLTIDEVRTIGQEAARDIADGGVEVVAVRSGVDWTNDPSYYLSFRVTSKDVDNDVQLFLQLSHRIRDRLTQLGDDHYPYVEVLGKPSLASALSV